MTCTVFRILANNALTFTELFAKGLRILIVNWNSVPNC